MSNPKKNNELDIKILQESIKTLQEQIKKLTGSSTDLLNDSENKIENQIKNSETKGYRNGIFYFSNPTKEDFETNWDGIKYIFRAGKTTPMIMQNFSSRDICAIRMEFAYRLAVKEIESSSQILKIKEQNRDIAGYSNVEIEKLVTRYLENLEECQLETEPIEPKDYETFPSNGFLEKGGEEELMELSRKNIASK